MDVFDVLNSKILFIIVGIGILMFTLICVFFFRRAVKRAKEMGIAEDKIKSTIKSSVIFSIVPSISVIIGLITLVPILGVPWPWFRLSVVGSLSYELISADLAVKGVGYEDLSAFTTSGDINAIGIIMFVMSICIMTGMVINIFFLEPYHKKIASGEGTKESPFRDLALSVLIIGMMSVFLTGQLFNSRVHAAVAIISAFVTVLLSWMSKKFNQKWLGDFVMSFALIIGMAAAVFLVGKM